jgi:hypothetical protein
MQRGTPPHGSRVQAAAGVQHGPLPHPLLPLQQREVQIDIPPAGVALQGALPTQDSGASRRMHKVELEGLPARRGRQADNKEVVARQVEALAQGGCHGVNRGARRGVKHKAAASGCAAVLLQSSNAPEGVSCSSRGSLQRSGHVRSSSPVPSQRGLQARTSSLTPLQLCRQGSLLRGRARQAIAGARGRPPSCQGRRGTVRSGSDQVSG